METIRGEEEGEGEEEVCNKCGIPDSYWTEDLSPTTGEIIFFSVVTVWTVGGMALMAREVLRWFLG